MFPFPGALSTLVSQSYFVFSRLLRLADRSLRSVIAVGLVIALLASSTPAAPKTIVGVTREWHGTLAFWLRANGVEEKLTQTLTGQNPRRPKPQEKQEERDGRVARIQIFPGNTTLRVEDRLQLTALALDKDGQPVAGVPFTFRAREQGG